MKKALARILALALVAVMAISLCACAAKPAETPATDAPATEAPATDAPAAETPATDAPAAEEPATESLGRVAVVTYPSSNTTIQVMMAGFLETAENLGFTPLYIGGDTTDAAAVEQMIDAAIAQYDDLYGACLNILSETKWEMAKKFTDAGIYVVGSWTALSDDDIAKYGVNPDYLLGYNAVDVVSYCTEAAEVIGAQCGGKGTIAYTVGEVTDNQTKGYEAFCKTIAEKYPDMKVLDMQLEGVDMTAGVATITSIIQANFADLVAGFGLTGTSAQTWSKAAEDTGWDGFIVGVDATSANLDILEAGGVDALVAQPLYDGYGYCAEMLYQKKMGQDVQFANIAQAPVILADAVPEYREMLKGADLYIKNMK